MAVDSHLNGAGKFIFHGFARLWMNSWGIRAVVVERGFAPDIVNGKNCSGDGALALGESQVLQFSLFRGRKYATLFPNFFGNAMKRFRMVSQN